MENNMKLSYELTYGKEETEILKKLVYQKMTEGTQHKRNIWGIRAVGLLMGSWFLLTGISEQNHNLFLYSAAGWLLFFGGKILLNYKAKRSLSKIVPPEYRVSVTIGEEGIHLSTPYTDGTFFWNYFTDWGEIDNIIYIKGREDTFLFLHRKNITDQQQLDLQTLLEDKISLLKEAF